MAISSSFFHLLVDVDKRAFVAVRLSQFLHGFLSCFRLILHIFDPGAKRPPCASREYKLVEVMLMVLSSLPSDSEVKVLRRF